MVACRSCQTSQSFTIKVPSGHQWIVWNCGCGEVDSHQPGRWHQGEDGREADWPCTAVTFDVQASCPNGPKNQTLKAVCVVNLHLFLVCENCKKINIMISQMYQMCFLCTANDVSRDPNIQCRLAQHGVSLTPRPQKRHVSKCCGVPLGQVASI